MAYLSYNGKILTRSSKWIDYGDVGPTLPPYTIRLKYTYGVVPQFRNGTAVQVSANPNIWDLTYQNSDWTGLLFRDSNLLEVIDANSTGVSNMYEMFWQCSSLTSVPLFDTSSVTNMRAMFIGCSSLTSVPLFNTSSVTSMNAMFAHCTSLTSVPLFNTSSVTDMTSMFDNCTSLTSVPLFDTSSVSTMDGMFYDCSNLTSVPLFNTSSATNMNYMFSWCYKVESGALALYQQASTQATVPSHDYTFTGCGRDTVTGAAELAQIPSSWGGTAN